MIIGAIPRLLLYILAGICPIWSEFVAVSSDYSMRGVLRPILASVSVAVVVMLARTRNPLVDGEPTPVTLVKGDEPMEVKTAPGQPLNIQAPAGKPVETHVTNPTSDPVPTESVKPEKPTP